MRQAFRRIAPYLAPYRWRYISGLFFVVLTNIVYLAIPWFLKYAVDGLRQGVSAARLGLYAALIVSAAIVQGVFRFFMRRILISGSRAVEYDLRNDYFRHLQRMRFTFFHRHRTGDLMARATNDLIAVRAALGPGIMQSWNTITIATTAIILMTIIDAKLTLFSLAPLPILSLSVYRAMRGIHRRFLQVQEQYAAISSRAQENISGIRVIRVHSREPHEVKAFASLCHEYVAKNLSLARFTNLLFPLMGLLAGIAQLIILYLGGREVIEGRVTMGEFVAFIAYLGMLIGPMMALGWVMNLFQRGSTSLARIGKIMDVEPEETEGRKEITSLRGRIECSRLTYSYAEGDAPTISDVSFTIEPGMKVAVVGPTGSGKTTLLNLIARLLDPPRGTLFIDGHDARDIPLSVLRRHIGYVPQETFLFSDTLEGNIAFGVPDAVRGEIEGAADLSALVDDIEDFPQRYETIVGERGITLSGGQRQRTTLARALLYDPTILLLDDAFSSVDTETEERILRRFKPAVEGRTHIVVSHRISTVKDADLIVVLDEGRIVEKGTHDELLERDGLYAAMCKRQAILEEIEAGP